MVSSSSSSKQSHDQLDFTVVSAQNLKNVNWRNGGLRPYVSVQLDSSSSPDGRQQPPRLTLTKAATQADAAAPAYGLRKSPLTWNKTFTFSLPENYNPYNRRPNGSASDSPSLSIHVFHSPANPQELSTVKPLVGSVTARLDDLLGNVYHLHDSLIFSSGLARKLDLVRPSGRPQGEVLVRIAVRPSPRIRPPIFNNPFKGYHDSEAPVRPWAYECFNQAGAGVRPPPPAPPLVVGRRGPPSSSAVKVDVPSGDDDGDDDLSMS